MRAGGVLRAKARRQIRRPSVVLFPGLRTLYTFVSHPVETSNIIPDRNGGSEFRLIPIDSPERLRTPQVPLAPFSPEFNNPANRAADEIQLPYLPFGVSVCR